MRSAIAASILQRAGIKEVVNLKGGFLAWKKKSFLIQLLISMCREIIFINLSDKENYGLHRSISINRSHIKIGEIDNLFYRPKFIQYYADEQMDIVLLGHAQGGQFKLLFISKLVALNQGVLPKYTAGLYEEQNTSMVVSRGLGNSIIPQRIFNRPELVVVQLN